MDVVGLGGATLSEAFNATNATASATAATAATLAINATNATNATRCTVIEVHDLLFDLIDDVSAASIPELVRNVTPYGVLAVSLVLCFCGYYAFRLVLGLTAFCAGIFGTVRLLRPLSVDCDAVTLIVFVSAGLTSLVAVFMTRLFSTLLGAGAAAVFVATVFATCGASCAGDPWPGAPRFLGHTLVPFWVSMLVAAAGGAFVARKHHRKMLAVVAALLGGFGVAAASRGLALDQGEHIPNWVFVLIMGVSSVVGLGTQYWCVWRRAKTRGPRGSPSTTKEVRTSAARQCSRRDGDCKEQELP